MSATIGATFPPNPVPGQLHFDNANTGELYVFSETGVWVSTSGGGAVEVTTADVQLTNPQTREGEQTQEDANQTFHSRIETLETEINGGTYSGVKA
jgi:hypothetical protein